MLRRGLWSFQKAAPVLPTSAKVVVMGGGVIGCSIAYHLASMGCKDVVLLERDKLTSGTTWHAAGLMVCFGSTSETSTEIRKYTKKLYQSLEAETGLATGFLPCGFIEIASDKDYLEEYRRVTAFNRLCGVDVHEIGPEEVKKLFPLCETKDVLAGMYVPDDGRVNPADVTMAMARGARMKGAKIIEGVAVEKVLKKNGGVSGVRTSAGDIECEYVVNCCGMWARQLGERNGVKIPLQAAEHYYLLTEPIPEIKKSWPVIEDPRLYGYYREEGGGMMVGLFEPKCAPWNVKKIPEDSSFTVIDPDWERMTPYLDTAMSRVPITKTVGLKKFFCGPESFTPDLKPIVGEAPDLKRYFVCAGLNSIGILTGGGMGRVMAHWILNGLPDVDVTAMNITRVNPWQCTPTYLSERIVEILGMVYSCHYPAKQLTTARNVRKSPIHERLKEQRAFFKEVSGWEGADWYAPEGKEPVLGPLSFGRHDWFPYWQKEHHAVRNGVIVMDMSFMCKYMIQGPGAGKALNWISANNVDGDANTITYTQWLNRDGCMEADLTVTKLDEDKFFVVATDTAEGHVEKHFRTHAPPEVSMVKVTAAYAQLNVQGPLSRELMQALTSTDMSNDAFPFRHAREIDIGTALVLCIRITYLGELGYELYVPSSHAVSVYDAIVREGKKLGLVHAGLKALASCRMEKGYRDFGHDLDNLDSVIDAGLGFAVDLKKPGGFLGKDAVLAHKASGNAFKSRIVHVLCLDPEPFMFHAEPILRNGKPVGYVRAASYGHTVGGSVALAKIDASEGFKIVDKDYIEGAKWEVNIAGKLYPAKISLRPFYDPTSARTKM
jgi:glycine cleavage system aminomethyltransferase T/glycine/D-amino acid oxidase-like deaminating enzyme